KVDQRQAEAKLRNDKKRMERKQDDAKAIARKQRDRENYFLGASLRKLTEALGLFPQNDELHKLTSLIECTRLLRALIDKEHIDTPRYEKILNQSSEGRIFAQLVQEILEDPRNPFRNKQS
ncbi:hypothetical protein G9F31_15590, partial [Acinetobacter sp. 187]|uniref:hypothetical protein n=1 Tax=Acinetobacter lanii TaxID=2715163 RepID=UPI00140A98AB